jgi:hypothetical protein
VRSGFGDPIFCTGAPSTLASFCAPAFIEPLSLVPDRLREPNSGGHVRCGDRC